MGIVADSQRNASERVLRGKRPRNAASTQTHLASTTLPRHIWRRYAFDSTPLFLSRLVPGVDPAAGTSLLKATSSVGNSFADGGSDSNVAKGARVSKLRVLAPRSTGVGKPGSPESLDAAARAAAPSVS